MIGILHKNRHRFFIIIGLLLVSGFLATSLLSYYFAANSLNEHIRTNSLPLTSDNIYSEIQRDVLPTVIISSLMAEDTFVRDWVLQGELEPQRIVNYLQSIQKKYETATAFFVSERSRAYYHSSGTLKTVTSDDAQDAWYFRVKEMPGDFEINVDTDTAMQTRTTIFVNHKVYDYEQNFIGAIGVGLSSETVVKLIKYYQQQYNRQVYFAERDGHIILSGAGYLGGKSVYDTPGLAEQADAIFASEGTSFSYARDHHEVFLEARYVPELKWFLFVEQMVTPEAGLRKAFWLNMLLSALLIGAILSLTVWIINKYQQKLEQMATNDKLTGLSNRHGFDAVFERVLRLAERHNEPMSVMLIDIDHFKAINDTYGHLVGDSILAQFSQTLKLHKRQSDLLCRWGGEEFLMALPRCRAEDAANIAQSLRRVIAKTVFDVNGQRISVTASFGVAQYEHDELVASLVSRADEALYRAKTAGRNRVEQA